MIKKMSKVFFEDVTDDIVELANNIINQNKDDLYDVYKIITHGEKFKILFFSTLEGEDLPPKYEKRAGFIRVVSDIDRVTKNYSFEIVLNKKLWYNLNNTKTQESILFHELYHIVLSRDKNDNIKENIDGSYHVKLKKHDIELGAFSDVILKYGQDSIDYKQIDYLKTQIQIDLLNEG